MNVVDYKCPSCGATLKFNPTNQKWDCEYCRNSFELSELDVNEASYAQANAVPLKDLDVYTCKNCGAEIMADANTVATFCVYCKSTAIIKNRLIDAYEPNKIIPFKNTKEDAINAFKKVGIKKIFMPKEFSDPKNINQMQGVYIPFWLFDILASGNISGVATRVSHWTTGSYYYTKTDYFNITRGGKVCFSNIPADGSQKFDDAIMNSIEPFDYKELVDFNYGYLSGFYAEKYDLSDSDVIQTAKERATNSAIDYLLKDAHSLYQTNSINSNNLNYEPNNIQYVLLPVWMLNIKYKDKIYPFAMNGQTGKMIGNIPTDKVKVFLFGLILFIIIFAITSILMILIGGFSL